MYSMHLPGSAQDLSQPSIVSTFCCCQAAWSLALTQAGPVTEDSIAAGSNSGRGSVTPIRTGSRQQGPASIKAGNDKAHAITVVHLTRQHSDKHHNMCLPLSCLTCTDLLYVPCCFGKRRAGPTPATFRFCYQQMHAELHGRLEAPLWHVLLPPPLL